MYNVNIRESMKLKSLLLNDSFFRLYLCACLAFFGMINYCNAQFGRTRGDLVYGFYHYDLLEQNRAQTQFWKPSFPDGFRNIECLLKNNNNGKIDFMINDSTIYGANGNTLFRDSRLQSKISASRVQLLLPFPQNRYVAITVSDINSAILGDQLNFVHFDFQSNKNQIDNHKSESLVFANQMINDMTHCRLNENLYALATVHIKYNNDTIINYINIYHITFNSSKLVQTIVIDQSLNLFDNEYTEDEFQHVVFVPTIQFSNDGRYLIAMREGLIKETYKLENSNKYSWRYIDEIKEVFCYNLNDQSQIIDSFSIIKSREQDLVHFPDYYIIDFNFSPDDKRLYYRSLKKDNVNSGMTNGNRNIISQYDFKLHKNTIYHEPKNSEQVAYFQSAYWGDLLILTIDGVSGKRKLLNAIYSDSIGGYKYPFQHFLKDSNEYSNMGFGLDKHSYVLNYLQPKLILTNPCKLRYKMENTKRLPNRFDKFTLYIKPTGKINYTDSQEVTDQQYFFPAPGKYAYYIRGSNDSTGYSEVYEDTIVVPDPRNPDFKNQIQPEIVVASTNDNFTNEVRWNSIPMAHHYKVFRDEIYWGNSTINSISDKFNQPISQAHTYYIIAEDSCEYLTQKSQTVKTIFLQNADDNEQVTVNTSSSINLTWNFYEGWSDPNPEYVLFNGYATQHWESVSVSGQNSYYQNNINPENWDMNFKEFYVQTKNDKGVISKSNVLKAPLKPILYIPNVFTPNADDKNEAFQLYAQGWKSLNYQVYNRWGQKIYETTETQKNWNPDSQTPSGMFVIKGQGQDLFQHMHYFEQVVYLLR